MGSTDQFRKGEMAADRFLTSFLYRAMGKPSWSEARWDDEIRSARSLIAGKSKDDVIELAQALKWSHDQEWWTYINTMGQFAAKIEKILPQYQGEMRKQAIIAKKAAEAGTSPDSEDLKKLRDAGYGRAALRSEIFHMETDRRHKEECGDFTKTCKKCKGTAYIKAKPPLPKGIRPGLSIDCPACREFKVKNYLQVRERVWQEVYAQVPAKVS